ncbi:MAG: hypothetical protein PGN37_07810 [Mycobacterium kyogaense]|uniref:hypothetical protein n=1 Tax=Mycobacterium kyogaense TaxID=2212479 RepID=UPI002FF6EC03
MPGDALPTRLPVLTRTDIESWDVDHLSAAASAWRSTARNWQDGFTAVNSAIVRPGGTEWIGSAADAASLRTDRDRVQVAGLADRLTTAAAVADRGADDLLAAKRQAMTSIGNATWAGFHVSEDLSVRDTLTTASKPQRLIRDLRAQVFAAEIRAGSLHLAAIDQTVASKLNTFTAGFGQLPFPQGPTKEPAPPKVPMPPYSPRVWGACPLGGGDPDKVVRTFHRAPLVDGVSAMPGGDSVLHCGNEKYGFYHIVNRHGQDWSNVAAERFPGTGNWRYLADYSIGATLSDPEKTVYNSKNDTFMVQRNIFRITEDGAVYSFTCRVLVSASDGKIITAYPTSTPI